MANQRKSLTASNIKYLLAMYRLYTTNNAIRSVKIAEVLDITKPSVHTMLDTLKNMNLVKKDARSEVYFTQEGLKLAKKYSGYYTVVSSLFNQYITNETDIRSASCAILAEVSEKSLSDFYTRQSISADQILLRGFRQHKECCHNGTDSGTRAIGTE